MIRGVYQAAASMVASMARVVQLANNIANISTPGYKQEVSAAEGFDQVLIARMDAADQGLSGEPLGAIPGAVFSGRPRTDLSQGALRETGRELDLAISGAGFFAVEKDGSRQYTRNGSFVLDAAGGVRTADGGRLMAGAGPLVLGPGSFTLETDGTTWQEGRAVGRLSLVTFPEDAVLRKLGDSYFQAVSGDPQPAAEAQVFQGYLEASNVEAVNTMVELMTSQRTYAASQRVLQMADSTLQRAVIDLGRLA